jgi:hypothetical protein
MGPVAQGAVDAVLATAEVNGARFFGFVGGRGEAAPFVGAVAKWLRGTLSAGTPVVGLSGLNLNGARGFLCNIRLFHRVSILAESGCIENANCIVLIYTLVTNETFT